MMSGFQNSCIITIDGPAGTGKSTVANALAARLGLKCLDTGALYRAIALLALEADCDLSDGDALVSLASDAKLHFDWDQDPPAILIGDRDVSDRIRDLDVSDSVSQVARQPELRTVLTSVQREVAKAYPRLVTEGRDQGSVVFPDADFRFFLDADEKVRAQRRSIQLSASGEVIDEEVVLHNIRERDRIDRSRKTAPLVRPEGSILIDSTSLSIEEVVDRMTCIVSGDGGEG
ncbi:MAG: (d)CMP kinase [Phycisphaerales bacterium]|nr:(d)CMP kinase [Phycisphaerales bacterium]